MTFLYQVGEELEEEGNHHAERFPAELQGSETAERGKASAHEQLLSPYLLGIEDILDAVVDCVVDRSGEVVGGVPEGRLQAGRLVDGVVNGGGQVFCNGAFRIFNFGCHVASFIDDALLQQHGESALRIQIRLSECREHPFRAHLIRRKFSIPGGHVGKDIKWITTIAIL